MKRRNFILASGSATFATGSLIRSSRPAVGLEFELSGIPSRDPEKVDSISVGFSSFKLTPHYFDKSKDIIVDTTVTLSGIGSITVKQSIDISDKTHVTKSDLSSKYPLVLDGINTSKDTVEGEIVIKISHDNIGQKIYRKSFSIQSNILNNIVSYYPAERNNGIVVHDAVNQRLGRLSNTTFTSGSAVGSYSLNFDPLNSSYVQIGNRSSLKTKGFTISAWAYPRDVSTYRGILVQRDINNDGVWLGCSSGSQNLSFYVDETNDFGEVIRSGDDGFTLNQWHHVVATYDGEEMRLYRNGNIVASKITSISPLDVGKSANIGANVPKDDEYWDGRIDEIRIYNRGFTQADVDELYSLDEPSGKEMTETVVPSQLENGVSYYNFNNDVSDSWTGYNGIDNAGSYVRGSYSSAKSFNQSNNDYVRVSHNSDLDPGTEDFTVSTWVRIPEDYTPSDHRVVVQKAYGEHFHQSDGVGWGISVQREGKIYFRVDYNNGNGVINSSRSNSFAVDDNKFHHIVAIRRDDQVEFYIDSTRIDTVDITNVGADISTTADMTFGATEAETRFITADIDETRIYSDSLNQDEIDRLLNKDSYLIE